MKMLTLFVKSWKRFIAIRYTINVQENKNKYDLRNLKLFIDFF